MRETFQTPGTVVLELRMPDGHVAVETADTAETVVDLTGADDADLRDIALIEMRETGGRFVITVEVDERSRAGSAPDITMLAGRLRIWRDRTLELKVRAPHGTELQVTSGSAGVRVRGRFASVAAQTGSGDVDVETVEGDSVVKTGSGDVRVAETGGDAVISTASGDVELARVAGSAQIRSASGDVRIDEAGTGVSVQTASGDQEIRAVTAGQVTLQSASGDMVVGIRRGSRLWVDARSVSGDTSSELEVGDEPPAEDEGPLVELRATAMSGDIHVVRA
jgi:hypothetical protein